MWTLKDLETVAVSLSISFLRPHGAPYQRGSRKVISTFIKHKFEEHFGFSYCLCFHTFCCFLTATSPVGAWSVPSHHLHVCTGWSSRFRFHHVIWLPAERFDTLHLHCRLIVRPEMIRPKRRGGSCLPFFPLNAVSLTITSQVKWAVTDGILFDSFPAGSSVQQFSLSPIRTLRFNSDKVIFPVVFYLIITSLEKPQKTHSFIDNMFNWAN